MLRGNDKREKGYFTHDKITVVTFQSADDSGHLGLLFKVMFLIFHRFQLSDLGPVCISQQPHEPFS